MPDYKNSKIYKVICLETNKVYYGSTTQKLSHRLNQHRKDYNRQFHNLTIFEVMKNNNYKMCLVENFSCNNIEELKQKETEYIINNECVNKQLPRKNISIDSDIFETEKFKLPPSPLVVA